MTATPPTSKVPLVRAYLESTLRSLISADPLPIAIDNGDPTQNLPNDLIILGETRRVAEPTTFIGSGGLHWLEEKFDLDIIASSWSGAHTTDAVTVRAWQVAGYITLAVRNDPSLGTLVNLAFPMASTSPGPIWTENPIGPLVTVTVTVHCESLN